MIVNETFERVRYADTDQMGYVYYGNYARYFEIGRTELCREIDAVYSEIERDGFMMPVVDMFTRYYKAARYDERLRIVTELRELPSLKVVFYHRVYNQADELCVEGTVTLVFVTAHNMKPVRPPARFADAVARNWDAPNRLP